MAVDRIKRVNELLKREISSMLFRVMNENGFDVSAVTITRVDTGKSLRNAKVYVSIRDHQDERRRMLAMISKHAPEIQQQINRTINIKYTPKLTFELDTSIEEGDRVLSLLLKLEEADDKSETGAR